MSLSHERAATTDQAMTLLGEAAGRARLVAGGTDLLGTIKDRLHVRLPDLLIDLKTIPGLAGVEHGEDGVVIGALTSIADIERHPHVRQAYPALAEAAHAVASPQLRNMGTIGGNICQEPRCWYYRTPENVFHCARKGGAPCNAFTGENRFHSVFGSMKVGTRPCTSACPGGVEIPEYMELLRAGRTRDAARRLLGRNPMPAVTGRVCPHYCQDDCNRASVDEAVSVRSVERHIGDLVLAEPDLAGQRQSDSGKSVAVVGSGPAGLSAAYYLSLRGHRVVVFERAERPGGMLRYGIPSYRLPKDVLDAVLAGYERLGVQFRCGVDVGDDPGVAQLRSTYDAVFLATGAWATPRIGLDGEEQLVSGIEFLAAVARGDRRVPGPRLVVVGGGSVAVDVAVTARRLGAKTVTIVCLESCDEMPALVDEVDEALREGIELVPSCGPARLLHDDGGLTGVELRRCVSVFDKQCRFSPTFDESDRSIVVADEVILAVGQRVETAPLAAAGLEVHGSRLQADERTHQTLLPGVFAAGDAVTGPATVIAALGAGRGAAASIHAYLLGEDMAAEGDADASPRDAFSGGSDGGQLQAFDPACLATSACAGEVILAPEDRTLMDEDTPTLEETMVSREARRCFNCGCVAVVPSDLAPALVALDASVVTSSRELPAERFFAVVPGGSTVLAPDEIVLKVKLPAREEGWRSGFSKFRLRNSIDFPIVSVAAAIRQHEGRIVDARIVLGAMAPVPLRAAPAEAALLGMTDEDLGRDEVLADIAKAAVADCLPLAQNSYKATIARSLVSRLLYRLAR